MNNVWFWVCVVLVIGLVFEVIDEVRRYKRREEKRDNWRLYYSYGRIMVSSYRDNDSSLEVKYMGLRREVLKKLCKDWSEYDVISGERKSSYNVRYI